MKSLVRWQPFQEFTSLQRQMNRLLHAFSGETSLMPFEDSLTGWEFGPPVALPVYLRRDKCATHNRTVPNPMRVHRHVT